ncbi:signal peptidase I [Streptomyces sp. WAC07061]|uniref:signal peptidase I n=1 Tax=Streptomyces sp. WAC07061 TaxID=2487410 RepID=UPI00163BE983|nr:signal peptidase I [Streptomyces sp. WAC07061]
MGSRGRPRGAGRPEPGRGGEPERSERTRRGPGPAPRPAPAREPAASQRQARDAEDAEGVEPVEPVEPPEPGGRAERRRLARKVRRRRRTRRVGELPLLVAVALCIALLLKTFLVQAFFIPSGSMEQTIRIGDRVLVDKLTPWFGSKVQRGEVVVFKDPGGWLKGEAARPEPDPAGVRQIKQALTFIGLLPSADEQDLIKRVIGVGGDTVKCCDARGRVTVNGTPLDEPYVSPGNAPSEIRFEVRVPAGRIFVMGDHRANSADSRYHLDEAFEGTVDEKNVVGQAVVIAWPFDHWRGLDQPATFLQVPDPVRGGRRRGPRRRRRSTPFA